MMACDQSSPTTSALTTIAAVLRISQTAFSPPPLPTPPAGSDAARALFYMTRSPESLLPETGPDFDQKTGKLTSIRYYFLLGGSIETSPRMRAKFKPDPGPAHAQRLFLSSLKVIIYNVDRPSSVEARTLVTSRADHKEQAGIFRKPASTFTSRFPFEKIWFNPDGTVFAKHCAEFEKMFPAPVPTPVSAPASALAAV